MRRRVGRLPCAVVAAFAEAVLSEPRTTRRGRPWPPWIAVHAADPDLAGRTARFTRGEVEKLNRVARALGVAPAVVVLAGARRVA